MVCRLCGFMDLTERGANWRELFRPFRSIKRATARKYGHRNGQKRETRGLPLQRNKCGHTPKMAFRRQIANGFSVYAFSAVGLDPVFGAVTTQFYGVFRSFGKR